MKERLLNWLNQALMLNIFLVLFAFAWFVVALAGEAFHFPLGLKLWYSLWEPVFTPKLPLPNSQSRPSPILNALKRVRKIQLQLSCKAKCAPNRVNLADPSTNEGPKFIL